MKGQKEINTEDVAQQIDEEQINNAKKFIEKLMMMNRKERRAFSKKAKTKWNNIPKYTKEMADKESRHIRKVTKEEDLERKQMKIKRKLYKKNRKK